MKALPVILMVAAMILMGGDCGSSGDECETNADCADLPCPDGEMGFCDDMAFCICDSDSGTGGTGGDTDGGMPDGGAGATGGTGATDGGMPSDCGMDVGSDVPALAGDITVFLNGVDVTGQDPPAVAVNGDTVRAEFLTTQGSSFATVSLVNGADSIGANGGEIMGGQTASIEVTVVQQLGMETVFAVNLVVDNGNDTDPPDMASLYAVEELPACSNVILIFDDNGSFDDPVDTLCNPSCLGYENE
ncbi:MAG: hypothetical protein AAF500_15135 [Myxococcota bacterium]